MGWRRMAAGDLPAVGRIADAVHPRYPESPAVPAERLALFPAGCLLAEGEGGRALGYCVSHPGTLGRPPALDSLLGALPAAPDCLYLHDLALLPEARGLGLGAAAADLLAGVAAARGLGRIALVAVNGSAPWWRRLGFEPHPGDDALAAKLATYDADAAYLVRRA